MLRRATTLHHISRKQVAIKELQAPDFQKEIEVDLPTTTTRKAILRKILQRDTLMFCTAAVALTAGGGCGFNCRQERNQCSRDDLMNNVDETLAKKLKDCQGDPFCEDEELDKARARRHAIELWYQEREDDNHEESREAREWLRNFLKDLGKDAVEKITSPLGSATGSATLTETVAIEINQRSVDPSSDEDEVDSGGVASDVTSASAAASGASQTITQSPTVITHLIRELSGSFTIDLQASGTFDAGTYSFNFSFATGTNRVLNGLNIRRLTAGAANLEGTTLALVLVPEIGQSQLVLGQNGIGILRLAGEIVSTDPTIGVPFNGFLKIDLPARQNSDGTITIDTGGVVDLNILADAPAPWFVDYDENGEITPTDRSLFVADHALGKVWTDLNGDEVSDGLDIERFDDRTSEALARLLYLATQGVSQ
jgi:hypothetical protein